MQHKKDLSLKSRGNSFVHAFNGLKVVIREPNAILHAIITVLVVVGGFAKHLTAYRWVAILFAIGLVWVTEALNTAIELLSDHTCESKYHPAIKAVKDVAAGAVLLAAITSVAIGVVVFLF